MMGRRKGDGEKTRVGGGSYTPRNVPDSDGLDRAMPFAQMWLDKGVRDLGSFKLHSASTIAVRLQEIARVCKRQCDCHARNPVRGFWDFADEKAHKSHYILDPL